MACYYGGCPQYACFPPAPCAAPCPAPCPPAPLCPLPVSFQAVALTPTTLVAAAATPLAFTYASVPSDAYSPVTSAFTAPRAGNFLFVVNVQWSTAVVTGSTLTLSLFTGGVAALTVVETQGVAGTYTAQITGMLSLASQASVFVVANCTTAATVTGAVPSPASLTWFSGTSV